MDIQPVTVNMPRYGGQPFDQLDYFQATAGAVEHLSWTGVGEVAPLTTQGPPSILITTPASGPSSGALWSRRRLRIGGSAWVQFR